MNNFFKYGMQPFMLMSLSKTDALSNRNLADTQDRGALDSTDFAIGMYFIQGLMSRKLSFLPPSLPPGLYQQAGGNPSSNQSSVRSHISGSNGIFTATLPQTRNIESQYTGQSSLLRPDNTGSNPFVLPVQSPFSPSSIAQNGHGVHWDISTKEKADADRFFDELDSQRRGYIEGDVAVPFMLKSNLPGEELAQVWCVRPSSFLFFPPQSFQ
jgi:epidermal growth factor receptor substrate 15